MDWTTPDRTTSGGPPKTKEIPGAPMTSNSPDAVQVPTVSPRFGAIIPPPFSPTRDRLESTEQAFNPDDFETRKLDVKAPTNSDGSPILAAAGHRITPLDMAKATEVVRSRTALWEGRDADQAPFTTTPKQHVVRDSTRRYAFTGTRLAYVSSEKPFKNRWTEIEVYRTQGGIYIVHRIGVTTLVHLEDCDQLKRYHKRYCPGINGIASDELAPEDRDPCPDCNPDLAALLHSEPAILKFERDRHQVHICETPEDVIQALHTPNRDTGKKELGSLAGSAVSMSSDRDPLLASVFYGNPA